MRRRAWALLALLVAATLPSRAFAVAGDLDPSFGSGGVIDLPLAANTRNDEALAIAVDDDDRVLVAGYVDLRPNADSLPNAFAIIRMLDDGGLDPNFGSAGRTTIPFDVDTTPAHEEAQVNAVALQSDGRIVLAGQAQRKAGSAISLDFAVARVLENGQPDTSFGTGGALTTSFQPMRDDAGRGVAIDGNGRIVVVGSSLTSSSNRDVAVARYQTGGALDPTFSGDGQLVQPIGTGHDDAFAVAIDGNDRIVIAGSAADGAKSDALVLRLLANGNLDTSFNGTGFLRIPFGDGNAAASAIAIQPDGDILIAGTARMQNVPYLAVARVTSTGALDAGFGEGGTKVTKIGDGSEGRGIVLHPSGRFAVGGMATVGGVKRFAAAQYRADGSLDPTFGALGVGTYSVGLIADEASAIAQRADGRLVLAGFATPTGTKKDFGIAQLTYSSCGDGVLQAPEQCDGNDLGGATCCSLQCTIATAGTTCRPNAGTCDVPETCNGASAACPIDHFQSAGVECRAVLGSCDVAEACTGGSAQCPADLHAPVGTLCRGALGICDVVESCDGGASCPTDLRKPSGTPCRTATDACDHAETCDGTAVSCPADVAEPAGTVCRAAGGACDVAEKCDGVAFACPVDGVAAAGTTCRAASSVCDVAETCDGAGKSCAADVGLPDGDGDGTCDLADVCPAVADPGQSDQDGDGWGDACDVCKGGVAIASGAMRFTGLGTPAADDTFVLKGDLVFQPARPAIDPRTNGVRVLLQDARGATLFDAVIPPGQYSAATRTGWRVNTNGTFYKFRTPTAVGSIVNKVKMYLRTRTPTVVNLKITGRDLDVAQLPLAAPLRVVVVVDPPGASDGHCGERDYPGPAPAPVCTFPTPGPEDTFTAGDVFDCR